MTVRIRAAYAVRLLVGIAWYTRVEPCGALLYDAENIHRRAHVAGLRAAA